MLQDALNHYKKVMISGEINDETVRILANNVTPTVNQLAKLLINFLPALILIIFKLKMYSLI